MNLYQYQTWPNVTKITFVGLVIVAAVAVVAGAYPSLLSEETYQEALMKFLKV